MRLQKLVSTLIFTYNRNYQIFTFLPLCEDTVNHFFLIINFLRLCFILFCSMLYCFSICFCSLPLMSVPGCFAIPFCSVMLSSVMLCSVEGSLPLPSTSPLSSRVESAPFRRYSMLLLLLLLLLLL